MKEIKVKKINENAKLPTYGSGCAACADLYAAEEADIFQFKTTKVKTGLQFELPKGYCGLIFARSGLATKQGLRPANCVGVCDEDYRGEYIVALYNDSTGYLQNHINIGDRIAQLMIVPYEQFNFVESDELTDTERGEGGFGSTGKN